MDRGPWQATVHGVAKSWTQLSSVQSLRHIWPFVTPWTAAGQASLSITNSWSLLKLMSTESVMLSNHLILCRPLLLLPSILPTIKVFSNESVLPSRWPKYWSFSFSINPSDDHSGLISFRMDWLDLLAVQGTLEFSPTPQFKSINSSALSFYIVQLSHPYMTTGKIALTRKNFVLSLQNNVLFCLCKMSDTTKQLSMQWGAHTFSLS